MLSDQEYLNVIEAAPLVSIDLLVRQDDGALLLGLRKNRPAQGTWFVPGGTIKKDKSLAEAFEQITEDELGRRLNISDAVFRGAFTHRYPDNFLGVAGITTHYVVLAYEIDMTLDIAALPKAQHKSYRWWTPEMAATSERVHPNTLAYFLLGGTTARPSPANVWGMQYAILNNRRDSFNQLVWQTPVLSLTAQAFLFAIVFSKSEEPTYQLIASILGLITAIASVQLLAKHRAGEEQAAKDAEDMERGAGIPKLNARNPLSWNPWYVGQSSFRVWVLLLWAFGATSFAVVIENLLSRL